MARLQDIPKSLHSLINWTGAGEAAASRDKHEDESTHTETPLCEDMESSDSETLRADGGARVGEQAGVRASRGQGLRGGGGTFWSRMGERLHSNVDGLGAPKLDTEKW